MTILQWQDQQVLADGVHHAVRIGRHPQGGGKPVLVMLHEALGSIAQWKDYPEQLALACGLSVVIYERQGHGGSDRLRIPRPDDYLAKEGCERLPALMDALAENAELDSVILVGHSDGGSIALVGAAAMPTRVVGLITAAAHLFVEQETRAGIEAAVAIYRQKLREPLMRYHADKVDTLFAAWHQTWLRESFQALDLSAWLAGIRCPALIIQGLDDQYGTARQVDAICAGIGQAAKPCWLPAAHVPHLEAPEACLQAMAEFVTTLPALRARSAATA